MICKDLTVTIKGEIWILYEFEIEGIDVKAKWNENDNGGSVVVKSYNISDDRLLDIYINIGAPNGTEIKVEVKGELEDGTKINSEDNEYKVRTNGKLRINLSLSI